MRRPNRTVEVFDISLMAVVTKAMGAFLVLMLLLIPYYTGPVPLPLAAEMAKQLQEARQKLQEAAAAGDPAELRRLLQEAQARIEQAERQLDELKRDNDALQAQVKRLEGELDEARAESEELKKKNAELSKSVVAGQLINWDCRDVRLETGVVTQNTYAVIDGKQEHDFLAYTSTLGDSFVRTDDGVVSQYPNQSTVQPGHGLRFNHAFFRYALQDDTYQMIVVSRSKTQKAVGKVGYYPLQHAANDCHLLITMDNYLPGLQQFGGTFVQEIVLPKTDYAAIVFTMQFGRDGMKIIDTPTETDNWFKGLIARAEKEPDASPTPQAGPSSPPSTSETERRLERLKQIEELRQKTQRERDPDSAPAR